MAHTPNDGLVSENMSNSNGMIPIIFSKKVALAFAKKSKVLDLLTNDYWEGEIKKEGDRVRIVFPDTSSVQVVTGDACPELQSVSASAQDLVIDKQMSFAFAITDKERGALKTLANNEGYKTYIVPDNVGGRYSVLTPVGLLPIAVAGIDIEQLVNGALAMETYCKENQNGKANPSPFLHFCFRFPNAPHVLRMALCSTLHAGRCAVFLWNGDNMQFGIFYISLRKI